MSKILVTGSIAYDILLGYEGDFTEALNTNAPSSLSVSYFSPHYSRHFGGTGANIAWGLKLLGHEPLLAGTVGRDGEDYLNKLKSKGIATDYIQVIQDQITATAIVNTDNREHQISFFHPGADSFGEWPELSQNSIELAIVSARDTAAMIQAMEWCRKNNVPVFFDPGQQAIAFGDDELERMVNMSCGLVVNEYEWDIVQKKLGRDEEGILEILGSVGMVGKVGNLSDEGILVVTRGDEGCLVSTRDCSEFVPAYKPDKVINPTGAGDAFRAGLLAGLSEGKDIISACKLGCAMGSAAVTQEGTLLEGISRNEIEKLIIDD